MSTVYTLSSYMALFAIGFLVWRTAAGRRARAAPPRPRAQHAEPRREPRAKRQRLESAVSDQDSAAQRSSKANASKPKPAHANNAPQGSTIDDSSDEQVDNREFAKQLASMKEGLKFDSKKAAGGASRQKSVKQSRAKVAEFADDDKVSQPSSTAGADADDDQSPAPSPEVAPVDGGGVSDMLEPAAAAPSVLRLTDTEPKNSKPKATKAPEPVESKKQRQNRKKAEAAKAAREQDEKERQKLMEAQRRLARISEGRAAKDGSQFMAAQNGNSAWAAPAGQGLSGNAAAPAGNAAPLTVPLDTFDETESKPSSKAPSSTQNMESSWISSMPSEEDQMEMLKTETEEWSTVKPKASKKSMRKADSPVEPEQPVALPTSKPGVNPVQKTKGAANGKSAKPTNSFGSFSALTTDGPDDDAEEKEWDI